MKSDKFFTPKNNPGALINNDLEALVAYKKRRQIVLESKQKLDVIDKLEEGVISSVDSLSGEINTLKDEFNSMKSDLNDIKNLLIKVLESK